MSVGEAVASVIVTVSTIETAASSAIALLGLGDAHAGDGEAARVEAASLAAAEAVGEAERDGAADVDLAICEALNVKAEG